MSCPPFWLTSKMPKTYGVILRAKGYVSAADGTVAAL